MDRSQAVEEILRNLREMTPETVQQVVERHPHATAHDVLLWSEALRSVA